MRYACICSEYKIVAEHSPYSEDDGPLTVTLRNELFPTLREGAGVPRFSKSHVMH